MEPESGNSFIALLELPPNQAMELLTDNPLKNRLDTALSLEEEVMKHAHISACGDPRESFVVPAFPSNTALVARAAKYSVFAREDSKLSPNVKAEPVDSGSDRVGSDHTGWSESENPLLKRKERENKGKTTRKTTAVLEEGEKLPYVHVRARRGQATDSHSLAERARREKINARMKVLQELVPGCNKISGTSLVLDEIINHVQYLQRQVEYLSMRLSAANPRIDFNLESAISAGTESTMDCNFPNMAMPLMCPEIQMNVERQQFQQQWHFEPSSQPVWVKEENHHNFVASENSHLSYDSLANSASLHSSQLKMEL